MRCRFYLGMVVILLFSGCNINNDLMLRTDRDYEFDDLPEEPDTEYEISPNDRLSFRLFANDGFQLVNVSTSSEEGGGGQNRIRRNQVSYIVQEDGRVKLPVLGRTEVEGLTAQEAEIMLEKKYRKYYNDPFVLLQVTNKRVIVFPGSGGAAKVVTLQNQNTTVMEVLAQVGGISSRGRAKSVKLIRRTEEGSRKVFKLDLSRINGLKYSDLVVQAEDIIYVEPTPRIASQLVQDIAPITSLISSALFVYSTVVGFNN